MTKIYKKYYMVVIDNKTTVRELKSSLPFSIKEGKDNIKSNHPEATKITHLSHKKVELLTALNRSFWLKNK